MIIAWNIRGLNKAGKTRKVGTRINKIKPDIAILVKTIVKSNKANLIRKKLGGHLAYMYNYSKHENGRIWLV